MYRTAGRTVFWSCPVNSLPHSAIRSSSMRSISGYPQCSFSRLMWMLEGLLSYGANNKAMYRQGAVYVVKIRRGAKPVDLPVEQPTTYELAVNLRTAKAIGVELPTSILLRADEVIE